MPSSTVEDYLKAIRRLSEQGNATVSVGRIAEELGVTPGTVTTMMRHLSAEEFVDYAPRRGVRLRERGESAALRVIRRHRLIELFLVEIMQLDWSHVHDEAEVLEHVVSDRLLQRMDEMLDFPTRDPHGDPIPDAEGRLPEQATQTLAESEAGHYRLVRVSDDEADFLDWLRENGLRPEARLEVVSINRPSGVLDLRLHPEGIAVQIGLTAAEKVLVCVEG